MRGTFYPRLALDGIRKNRRLYVPYLFTCGGMVAMFYIISYLISSDAQVLAPFHGPLGEILKSGQGILGIFSLLFLFYTNSFLMRRRKKEFGLYHVLGMGKRNLGVVLFWEHLILAVVSLVGGLAAGAALSKLAELGLYRLTHAEITYALNVSPEAVMAVLRTFSLIFLLLFLNALRQIWFSKALSLLKSENVGEKPPKANWLLGIAGIVLLGWGYFLSVTAKSAMEALSSFFVAVVLVMGGTYLLMTAGSVLLCRVLQKWKGYYYRTNHFVSVSSMTYRMKRNGAGLAAICILATMILVMLSATGTMYADVHSVIQGSFPRQFVYSQDTALMTPEEQTANARKLSDAVVDAGAVPENVLEFQYVDLIGYLAGEELDLSQGFVMGLDFSAENQVCDLQLVSLADYCRITGTQETLKPGEAMLHISQGSYDYDHITLKCNEETISYSLVGQCAEGLPGGKLMTFPTVLLVVPDLPQAVQKIQAQAGEEISCNWNYFFDTDLDAQGQAVLAGKLTALLPDGTIDSYVQGERDFMELYGGLLYLGVTLSVVFLFAAVLMLYYKQISEGYEDQGRFQIMEKVGMSAREVRRSINSQLLTVFFLPLGLAGVHLVMASPLIRLMLRVFNVTNSRIYWSVTLGCFLVFGIFYLAVYRITSNAYYRIVRSGK